MIAEQLFTGLRSLPQLAPSIAQNGEVVVQQIYKLVAQEMLLAAGLKPSRTTFEQVEQARVQLGESTRLRRRRMTVARKSSKSTAT